MFWCERGDDLLEARIATQRVPEGQRFPNASPLSPRKLFREAASNCQNLPDADNYLAISGDTETTGRADLSKPIQYSGDERSRPAFHLISDVLPFGRLLVGHQVHSAMLSATKVL